MKPHEIWDLTLWEYNMYMHGQDIKAKNDTANCILTGYYTAYYMNGGKKAKNPNELISSLFTKKQTQEEGLREIEKIKKLEKGGNYG